MRIHSRLATLLFLSLFAVSSHAGVKKPHIINPVPVFSLDNQYHLIYELKIAAEKDKLKPHYTLTKVDVLNKSDNRLITQYEGESLKPLVYLIHPNGTSTQTTELDSEGQLMVFPFVNFADKREIPAKLIHRFHFTDKDHPDEKIVLRDGTVKVSNDPVDVISSPLHGGGWLAVNGLGILGSHRFAYLDFHGSYFIGQRFAIDWTRIDEKGNVFFPGSDQKSNENCIGFGAEIYSGTDGVVKTVRNEFEDNVVGEVPEKAQNVDNACGNQITVAMDNGHYAHYCHLKRDSIKVRVGDRLTQGQSLALLGNSGNSSGPHLHFHISDNKTPLGSEGLPFIISRFGMQITPEKVEETGILDFHPSETALADLDLPGVIIKDAIPKQNGVYYFYE